MRKWIIKKNDVTGKLEVWEYIDTVEEANKYWYVKRAIRESSVEEVLPIAMNPLGGYHSLHYDIEAGNIVEIVESENPPALNLSDAWGINEPDFNRGWIAPDCTTYSCGYMEHYALARDICRVKYNKTGELNFEDLLTDKGWIRVCHWGWDCNWKKVNDKQILLVESIVNKNKIPNKNEHVETFLSPVERMD